MTLIALLLAGCSAGTPRVQGNAAPSAARPVDPTDAATISSRLLTICPPGWRVVRTERDTYPWYRPEGKGIGVFLAPPEFRQRKTDYELAVFVMPPDYQDGGDDPLGGAQAQTYPPQLVGATDRMKIYVWGGWNDGRDLKAEEQIRDVLVK